MDEPAARARRPPAGRRPGRGGDRTTGGLRGVDLARQALVAAPGAARKNAAAPRKPERRTTTVVRRYRPERCTPPARRRGRRHFVFAPGGWCVQLARRRFGRASGTGAGSPPSGSGSKSVPALGSRTRGAARRA
ncbi:hypothetical protein D1794_29170 (plasmid) [Streptomyces clavuligerus]|nr:hypothetical protein D1794_29170 [Streptomyces clavuligerus]